MGFPIEGNFVLENKVNISLSFKFLEPPAEVQELVELRKENCSWCLIGKNGFKCLMWALHVLQLFPRRSEETRFLELVFEVELHGVARAGEVAGAFTSTSCRCGCMREQTLRERSCFVTERGWKR